MNLQNIIHNIIFLPRKCRERANESSYSLLQESGYFQHANEITKDHIREVILQFPECVALWLQWSEDKRTQEGWYFSQDTNLKYSVGRVSKKGNTQQKEYSNAITACAIFIKEEIENIRTS
jgi:hypothetical protein